MNNKFRTLTMSLTLAAASSSFAETYSCRNVDGVEEWTIYVDTESKKAAFFDNDTTVVIPLKSVRQLESLPPQISYEFEGKDGNGLLGIYFNETRLSASARFNLGTPRERSVRSLDGCQIDRNFRLGNGLNY